VHQAKGLEWRAVFVVWLADGRFPSAQALKDRDGEEEERRLFYVACTRARDDLYLAFPVVAAPKDRERVVMKASRFLEELPGDPPVYERWQLDDAEGPPALVAAEEPARLAPAPAAALLVPALFGEELARGGRMEETGGGGDDVPF
jgi:DNA helicase-2/ATP-dependent DNA helicase PcrA